MALGDLMASRFSQSVSNHLDECSSNHRHYEVDGSGDYYLAGQQQLRKERDSETATTTASSNSYGNDATTTATVTKSMLYLPQTIVLCDLRHDAFMACVASGPSDNGLISKWRPKDRISKP